MGFIIVNVKRLLKLRPKKKKSNGSRTQPERPLADQRRLFEGDEN